MIQLIQKIIIYINNICTMLPESHQHIDSRQQAVEILPYHSALTESWYVAGLSWEANECLMKPLNVHPSGL